MREVIRVGCVATKLLKHDAGVDWSSSQACAVHPLFVYSFLLVFSCAGII